MSQQNEITMPLECISVNYTTSGNLAMYLTVFHCQQWLQAMRRKGKGMKRVHHEEWLTEKTVSRRGAKWRLLHCSHISGRSRDISFCKCFWASVMSWALCPVWGYRDSKPNSSLIFWRFLLSETNVTAVLENTILANRKTWHYPRKPLCLSSSFVQDWTDKSTSASQDCEEWPQPRG